MKITAFSDAFPATLATGGTWIGSASGSNSGYTGGDVLGEPGELSVVALRNVVSLASNMGDSTLGTVLTTIQSSPWVAQFAASSNSATTPATSVTSEATLGIVAAVGVGTSYARADHTHGSPDASAVSSAGFRGELLISSAPSNPIVFGDVMLNSDGTDFVYASM